MSIRRAFPAILASIVSLNCLLQWACAQKSPKNDSASLSLSSLSASPGCLALEGTYAFLGEALPGMPNYFLVKAIPLTLDVMLGFQIPSSQPQKDTRVEIVQGQDIELAFYREGKVVERLTPYEPRDSVYCETNKVIIKKSRHTSGEAVTGETDFTHTLMIDPDRMLIITTEITGQSKSLFFRYSKAPEIYGARFRRLDK